MRLSIALLCIACALTLPSPARALDWAVGIQVAGNSHSLNGELPDDGKWQSRFGFGGGLMFDLAFRDDIVVSVQPTYTSRDSRQVLESQGTIVSEKDFNLKYFACPVVVRVSSSPDRVRGFVTAGVSPAWLGDATLEEGDRSEDISQLLDDFSLGALFGAGCTVATGAGLLIFEFRYEQGIEDIRNLEHSPYLDAGTNSSVKYRELRLQAGILFGPGAQ